jgi:hypothetical protein
VIVESLRVCLNAARKTPTYIRVGDIGQKRNDYWNKNNEKKNE